ncbi:unnamed protein product [Calicophoron daubneyi]|uniref:Uncharacterized protein n=1 Tax=Calicophoron daubneyi TaxID=300641 RepID=A0AAV2T6M2_CALDB
MVNTTRTQKDKINDELQTTSIRKLSRILIAFVPFSVTCNSCDSRKYTRLLCFVVSSALPVVPLAVHCLERIPVGGSSSTSTTMFSEQQVSRGHL